MTVNPNEIPDQRLINLFNKLENKINEVIAESSLKAKPLDLSKEEEE